MDNSLDLFLPILYTKNMSYQEQKEIARKALYEEFQQALVDQDKKKAEDFIKVAYMTNYDEMATEMVRDYRNAKFDEI